MTENARKLIEAGAALEEGINRIQTVPCPCVLAELLADFTIEDIKAIARYQARMCAYLGEKYLGGDYRANEMLVHILERYKQIESTDIFNNEILEK